MNRTLGTYTISESFCKARFSVREKNFSMVLLRNKSQFILFLELAGELIGHTHTPNCKLATIRWDQVRCIMYEYLSMILATTCIINVSVKIKF